MIKKLAILILVVCWSGSRVATSTETAGGAYFKFPIDNRKTF